MPPIFPIKGYVNPFFLSEKGKRMLGLDTNYARELSGTWAFGLRTDYPYRTTLDGVLAELKKQHGKKRKLRKKKK